MDEIMDIAESAPLLDLETYDAYFNSLYELLSSLRDDVNSILILLNCFLVILGIIVSFFIVRLIWRLAFKPALRFFRLDL